VILAAKVVFSNSKSIIIGAALYKGLTHAVDGEC
jgi:hypothetical protein